MPDPGPHLDLGGYVLNNIDEAERKAFEEHLLVCDACQLEVQELTDVKSALSELAANPVPAAPSGLRDRTFEVASTVREAAPTNSTVASRRMATIAFSLLALVVLVVVFVSVRQANDADDALGMAMVSPSGEVSGEVVLVKSPGGREVRLRIDRLEPSSPDSFYEGWLVTEQGDAVERPDRISIGTFRVPEKGSVDVTLGGPVDGRYPFVTITRERNDGNPALGGPEVLRSSSDIQG